MNQSSIQRPPPLPTTRHSRGSTADSTGSNRRGGAPAMANAFLYLKIAAGLLIMIGIAASVAAGLVVNEVRAYRARLQPETWESMMMDQGLPHGFLIALCAVVALTCALLAAFIYTAAAISERLLDRRRED